MSDPDIILAEFSRQRLLVVGDVFLDDYLVGRAERLSREAPIPILSYTARRQVPGGGANPAMNAAALGAQVSQVGVVGQDPEAAVLRDLLAAAGIDTAGLIVDPARPTVTKTRIVAEGELRFPQQVARVDRAARGPVGPEIEAAVLAAIRRRFQEWMPAALLVSDYRSGLVTRTLAGSIRDLAGGADGRPVLLTADAQGDLDKYRGFSLVKCNRAEAESFVGRPLDNNEVVAQALGELNDRLEAQSMLITRGVQGLSVGVRGQGCTHIPAANATEVYDVTGAGDTVIAVATLALCAGADPVTAARMANSAAGLVVRKWGNAVVSPAELRAAW